MYVALGELADRPPVTERANLCAVESLPFLGAVASSWYGAAAMLVDAVVIWLSFSAR